MIVTIDGPSGAGKSSAAKALAGRLGFEYLDTGAMYRAVALAALEQDCNINNDVALRQLLDRLELDLSHGCVVLNGRDVSEAIRSNIISEASSAVAKIQLVRDFLVGLQRSFASERNFVTEGRDQGTVVFPCAECKFFLVADPDERARRRHQELVARGQSTTLDEVLRAQQARDEQDASRKIAPLTAAEDAIVINSTKLSLDEVVGRMEEEVRHRKN